MTTLQSVARSVTRALTIATLFSAPGVLLAQEGGPARISVRLVNVKADAVAQFEAAIADRAAVEQAAGRPALHVYERIRGPDLPGYTITSIDSDYNDLPPVQDDPAWIDRILHSINDSTLLTIEIYPELGIPVGSLAPSGEFMRVRVRTTSPSNRQAYFEWHRDELTPALREGGITDLRSGRIIMGGNSNTFVRYTFANEFPAQGPDVAAAVGEREFERIISREPDLLVSSEDYVYRYRPELSFTAEE